MEEPVEHGTIVEDDSGHQWQKRIGTWWDISCEAADEPWTWFEVKDDAEGNLHRL